MDFMNLNKACPKDAYLLPSMDKLVDGALEVKFLHFMDAYSSYNHIRIHHLNEEKMVFIIENANYCYKVMSFGLKNARATLLTRLEESWKSTWMIWLSRT